MQQGIDVKFGRKPGISASLSGMGSVSTGIDGVRVITIAPEHYAGAYSVAPDFEGITLETRDKLMEEDMQIEPIEVSRVSNPTGGTTVYIGGMF